MKSYLVDYKKNGFVVIRDFFNQKEIQYFQQSTSSIISSLLKRNNLNSKQPLHDGFIQLDSLNHQKIHNLYDIVKNSDAVGVLTKSKKMINLVKNILNPGSIDSLFSVV